MLTQTWDAYLNQIIWKITKKLNASKINSTKTNLFGNEITSYRWIRNVKPNWWILLALLSNKFRRKKEYFLKYFFCEFSMLLFLFVSNRQTIFYLQRVQHTAMLLSLPDTHLWAARWSWSSRRRYCSHLWPYFVRQQHQSFMSTRTKIGLLTAREGSACFTALMWSRRQLHLSPLQPILTQG